MRCVIFSTIAPEVELLSSKVGTLDIDCVSQSVHELRRDALLRLCKGVRAVSVGRTDVLNGVTLRVLREAGVEAIVVRHPSLSDMPELDLDAVRSLNIQLCRIPHVSSAAVAELTIALVLSLFRNVPQAYVRAAGGNLTQASLIGHELGGKTCGLLGTGRVGVRVAHALAALGCKILAYDAFESPHIIELGGEYVSLDELWERSDIISLHAPLVEATRHIVNDESIRKLKHGTVLVNTSRGGLMDPAAVLRGLESGQIGALGVDVFECDNDVFLRDHGVHGVPDKNVSRILAYPRVLVTPHLASFTTESLTTVCKGVLTSLEQFERGERIDNCSGQ
ncbi:2-hydroxyacid dehydrogenase-like [Porphyridium purpureum]|uniref:2-hydroxyacid dehydrogenase-like n=1 Tax=Porphyridium purpureum TaxID=35688 RepID=A0A5J4YUP8_PORPP|nr:2-hydroxyacid dehydrogenase-like [Porphyridium purpureum]|eukprot:POR6726..scf227_4